MVAILRKENIYALMMTLALAIISISGIQNTRSHHQDRHKDPRSALSNVIYVHLCLTNCDNFLMSRINYSGIITLTVQKTTSPRSG